jgi:hypothetical protein
MQASEAVNDLVELMKKKDSPTRRRVVQYQVEQIIQILRGFASPQELIPLPYLLKRVHKRTYH